MARIIGRLTSVGIAKEAVRGTALAPTYWVGVRSLDFEDTIETKDNESGFGAIDAVQDSAIIKQWAEGGFEGKIYDLSEGVILRALCGAAPVSAQRAASGVYDHTFTPANNNLHSTLCIAVKDANNSLRYANAVVDSYSFEATLDDYIHRTVSFVAKKGAAGSDTLAYTNENEFLPKHMVAKFAAAGAASGTIDAASAVKIRGVSFEVNKNAEGLQVMGSNDIDDAVNKQLEITGSIEMYYDDTTYKTLFQNGTHQSVRLDIINTDVTIGSTHNPAIRFEFADIVITGWSKGFDNNDIQTQTLEFKATLNLTLARAFQARLTNLYAGTNY